MAIYEIVTSEQQEQALTWEYGQATKAPAPPMPVPAVPTQAEYLQMRVDQQILNPMVERRAVAVDEEILSSLATIPEPNRPEAAEQISVVIVESGGEIKGDGLVLPTPPTPEVEPEGGVDGR